MDGIFFRPTQSHPFTLSTTNCTLNRSRRRLAAPLQHCFSTVSRRSRCWHPPWNTHRLCLGPRQTRENALLSRVEGPSQAQQQHLCQSRSALFDAATRIEASNSGCSPVESALNSIRPPSRFYRTVTPDSFSLPHSVQASFLTQPLAPFVHTSTAQPRHSSAPGFSSLAACLALLTWPTSSCRVASAPSPPSACPTTSIPTSPSRAGHRRPARRGTRAAAAKGTGAASAAAPPAATSTARSTPPRRGSGCQRTRRHASNNVLLPISGAPTSDHLSSSSLGDVDAVIAAAVNASKQHAEQERRQERAARRTRASRHCHGRRHTPTRPATTCAAKSSA